MVGWVPCIPTLSSATVRTSEIHVQAERGSLWLTKTQATADSCPREVLACLVVRGASTIEVAINGVHLKGISGPVTLHGGLHIVVAVEGDSALLVVTAKASYDHRVLILYWPADFDLSSCSTALPLTNIIDKPLSR